MADIVLKNGWNQKAIYKNVTSVSFETTTEGVKATYYENGNGGTGPSVQVDWEQNDSTAQDYIKNRPFYSYFPPIISPVNTSIESKTFQGLALYGATLNNVPALTAEYYVVYWNDTGWRCRLTTSGEGIIYLGTYSILRGEAGENGEPPFCGVYSANSNSITLYALKEGGFPVGLLEGEEVVKKIDDKYLPETALSGGANWNAEPGQDGYIENKPTDLVNEKFVQDEIAKVQQNVQSDWNAVEPSLAAIKKKPTDLANTQFVQDEIGKIQQNVQSDWNAVEPSLAAIKNKPNNLATTPYVTSEINKVAKALEDYVKNEDFTKQFEDSQADWNIEDETNLAAIKNKPFGYYQDILTEQSFEPAEFIESISGGATTFNLDIGTPLQTGKTYLVIWNGQTYSCSPGVTVSGRPFQLSASGVFSVTTRPAENTIITLRLADNIRRLDKKFLPVSEIINGLATETYVNNKINDVPQANWTQTVTTAKDFIKNKPTDLANKKFVQDEIAKVQQNVQSDWNAAEPSLAAIKNKPTIPNPQVQSNWGQIDPNKIDYIKGKPTVFADWNETGEKITKIANMPEAFRHSEVAEGETQAVLDTPEGWVKKSVPKLTMTVTFDDETVKIYSIVGSEVVE